MIYRVQRDNRLIKAAMPRATDQETNTTKLCVTQQGPEGNTIDRAEGEIDGLFQAKVRHICEWVTLEIISSGVV